MTEEYLNSGRWSLESIYDGFDGAKFAGDMARLAELNAALTLAAESLGKYGELENLRRVIPLLEERRLISGSLGGYCEFRRTVDTADREAASVSGRVSILSGGAARPMAEITRYISGIVDIQSLIEGTELEKYADFFAFEQADGGHLLSGDGEDVAAKYDVSGGGAWEELHSYMTSSVSEELDGREMSLSELRNLAYDQDPKVRKAAYEAELSCCEKIKAPVAFALNSIKLQSISECELRGFDGPLTKSLHSAHMKKETLDALWGAIEEYLPIFHKYYRLKAKAMGYSGGLPWYEMFAPMGSDGRRYTAEEARDYLVDIFSGFDPELGKITYDAFEKRWIDLYPRQGKVGGAYCESAIGVGEFRILTNFGGLFGDVVTIAHELGHGYHEMLVKNNPLLYRDYAMPVAETASTFNENLVVSAAIESARSREEKLALIENRLQDAAQIICDIYSRFLFEKSVCDNRSGSFMFAEELCDMMRAAQKKAYGDGLDERTLNPYMWLCKAHYYSSGLSFYNYPYAFGGLLARGLYERYKKQGDTFLPAYRKMLSMTPMLSVEDSVGICGIDLSSRDFWRESLDAYRRDIELFEELVK